MYDSLLGYNTAVCHTQLVILNHLWWVPDVDQSSTWTFQADW